MNASTKGFIIGTAVGMVVMYVYTNRPQSATA